MSSRLEVVALPLPPHLWNRLLAAGFSTVADLERAGGPVGLARGERSFLRDIPCVLAPPLPSRIVPVGPIPMPHSARPAPQLSALLLLRAPQLIHLARRTHVRAAAHVRRDGFVPG
jgi:hypothetical protein